MMLTGEPRAWRLKGSEDGKLLHLVEEKSLVQFDMDMKDVANIMVESIEQWVLTLKPEEIQWMQHPQSSEKGSSPDLID